VSYLQSITRSNGDNLGGILSIRVARVADIVSIPDDSGGVIYGNITFTEGKGWVTWEVTFESPNINSGNRVSREGFASINGLPLRIPTDKPGTRPMLLRAAEDELILLFTDGNGNTKVFGTLQQPVRFRFNHDTGKAIADGNFYEGQFYYEGPDNIFFYDGSVSEAPSGPAPGVLKWKLAGQDDSEAITIATFQPGETKIIESDFDFNEFHTIQ